MFGTIRRYLPLPDTGRLVVPGGGEVRRTAGFGKGGSFSTRRGCSRSSRKAARFCLSDASARATPSHPRAAFVRGGRRDVRCNAPRGSSRTREGGREGRCVEGGWRRKTAEEGGCRSTGWVRGVGFRGGGGVVRRDERTPYAAGGERAGGGEGEVRRGRRLVPNSAH